MLFTHSKQFILWRKKSWEKQLTQLTQLLKMAQFLRDGTGERRLGDIDALQLRQLPDGSGKRSLRSVPGRPAR